MAQLIVHIAERGTPLNEGGQSSVGHMWIELVDDNGNSEHYGFAPAEHGVAFGPGRIYPSDGENYTDRAFSRSFDLNAEQFAQVQSFARDPNSYGFDPDQYNGLNNNCIDFTWKALEVAEVAPPGRERDFWPTLNIDDVLNLQEPNTLESWWRRTWDETFALFDSLDDLGSLVFDEIVLRLYNMAIQEMADLFENIFPFELIDPNCNTDYNRALNWLPPRDPLVLDLDGDGIETSGVNPNLLFDHNADGIKTGTGWVNSDDGLLVMDRDGNGLIDNGRELFGDQTIKSNGEFATDGFDALRDLDANGDSIIDSRDTRFGELRVWRDLNQDGVSQANEMQTLNQAGITQISLDVNDIADQNLSGGTLTQTATFTRDDKTTSTVGNVNLTDNGFYRENSVISPMRTLSINMAA